MTQYKITKVEYLLDDGLNDFITLMTKDGWRMAFNPDIKSLSCTNGQSLWYGKITWIKE